MKPRTKNQMAVMGLFQQLKPITEKQLKYTIEHGFNHHALTGKGKMTCLDCGGTWKDDGSEKCVCPHCGMKLRRMEKTRKRKFTKAIYYEVITAIGEYQVLRYFKVESLQRVGRKAEYVCREAVQKWVGQDGGYEVVSRARNMSVYYCDCWNFDSEMEIKEAKESVCYNLPIWITYPYYNITSVLRRNGYRRGKVAVSNFALIRGLLSDSRCETLMKAGQYSLLKVMLHKDSENIEGYWKAIKICIRNNYIVKDGDLWCDYIDFLMYFHKDITNAKYVCPSDLIHEHNRWMKKKEKLLAQMELAEEIAEAEGKEEEYLKEKEVFFGLNFSDGVISIQPLRSVKEFVMEGQMMHHCVFSNHYYTKKDSLILSATVNNMRMETIEVSLKNLEVKQCHGKWNKNSEYHEQILSLVNSNMHLIGSCISA